MMNTIIRNACVRLLLVVSMACGWVLTVSADEVSQGPQLAGLTQQQVNVNDADALVLAAALKGVGVKKAEAIVAWREAHGGFESLDQLLEVKGIGSATLAKNQALIRLE